MVDLFGLFKTFARGTCHSDTLATCEIDEVKLAYLDLLGCIVVNILSVAHDLLLVLLNGGHLFNDDNEDGMRARTHIVHFGGGSGTAQSTLLHQTVDLVRAAHSPLTQTLNEDTLLFVLTDLERGPIDLQEIRDHLIVDLKVARTDHKGSVLRRLHLDESKDLFHRPGHNTTLGVTRRVFEALHRVGLTGASLSIGKNGGIVALEDRPDSLFGCILIDPLLGRVLIVHMIKGEGLPDAQVRISIHVPLSFLLVYFSA